MGYNGWANWTTWSIALWLQNDEGMYLCWEGRNRELIRTGKRWGAGGARRFCRDVFGERTPDGARVSAKCIDWGELVAMLNEGLDETRKYHG
jgi:hypothetical protein